MKFTAKELEKIEKTKSFLKQVKRCDERIDSIARELCRLGELKYTIGISLKTDEKGSAIINSGTSKQSTDAAYVEIIAKIDVLKKKLESEAQKLTEIREQVYAAIETAYNAEAKRVLWYIYIDGITIESIAEKMAYSTRQIGRIHKRALLSVRIE